MSKKKKAIREAFRSAVFKRDGYKCRVCSKVPEEGQTPLDAHHITDRTLMPNGGYVKENGISLCAMCHFLAEEFHISGVAAPGYEPETLYKLIGSSYELAVEKSNGLS